MQAPAEIKEEFKQKAIRRYYSTLSMKIDGSSRQEPVNVNAIDGIDIPSSSTPKAIDTHVKNT